MRTLVVDDSELMRQVLAQGLRERGHDAVLCADAELAWAACQAESFPLVVIDWILPGMDGLELCRRIRALPTGDRCVILIVTAQDQPEHLAAVLDAGASDYLSKPFTPNMFQVRLAVAERQAAEIEAHQAAQAALVEARVAAAEASAWRELSRQQRLMIRVIAHELKTPLATIFGFSELLLELEPLSERLRSQLALIHQGATRLDELVNNIVDLSMLERWNVGLERMPLDLAVLLPFWVAELAKPPRVTVSIAPRVPWVAGDEARLRQVVHHLLKNSITFSPSQTPVEVSLRADGPSRVVIEVVDHGPGIPPERLERVFDPFFRTDLAHEGAMQGMGIGLALVHRIVELHDGEVAARSDMRTGTAFTVSLPTAEPVELR